MEPNYIPTRELEVHNITTCLSFYYSPTGYGVCITSPNEDEVLLTHSWTADAMATAASLAEFFSLA